MNYNPFDYDLDLTYYNEYETERKAWDRARAAFAGIAVGFFMAVMVLGSIWFGVDDERATGWLGVAVASAIWVSWRYFEKTCTVRLHELDRLAMERMRQRKSERPEVACS